MSDHYYREYSALQMAVRKFLSARGNDLCHENRNELAKAARLPYEGLAPNLPPRAEFAQKCIYYQDEIYGKEPTIEDLILRIEELERRAADDGRIE